MTWLIRVPSAHGWMSEVGWFYQKAEKLSMIILQPCRSTRLPTIVRLLAAVSRVVLLFYFLLRYRSESKSETLNSKTTLPCW